MTLRECVENEFGLVHESELKKVINWLEQALGIDENDQISEELCKVICDRHWERSERDLFNWIHDSDDETPSEIHEAPWVTDLDNVLILKESCYFWYEINN